MSLLERASLRYLAQHRLQCALAVSGVALGVAIVIAIQLIQQSARDSLARAFDSLLGSATHHVVADAGEIDETLLFALRRSHPQWQPAPVIEARVSHVHEDEPRTLRILGIDPVSSTAGSATPLFDIRALMRTPGAAVIDARSAASLGLVVGDTLSVARGGMLRELRILATPSAISSDGSSLPGNTLLVDIATAQETLGMHGRLSRIALRSPLPGGAPEVELPAGVRLQSGAERRAGARRLTRAFYTNLDALSLLALLVGAFLIHNTVSFLVVQRRYLFARLRAIGATRNAVMRVVLGEAATLGLVGGVGGVALGVAMAHYLLGPLGVTLGDHYGSAAAGARLSPALAIAAMALSLGVALAAAAWPAWQAADGSPARGLRREAPAPAATSQLAALGVSIATVGLVLLAFSTRSLGAGFVALGAIMVGTTLCTPAVMRMLLAGAALLRARLALPERLALASTRRALGPIGVAVAALVAATATSIGVGLMVASFRVAVIDWLEQLLRADIYVSQAVADDAPPSIDRAFIDALAGDPRIEAISSVRRRLVAEGADTLRVTAYELPPAARAGFEFIAGNSDTLWREWDSEPVAIVSEPLAWHRSLGVGDELVLPTPDGEIGVRIAGIYRDYGSERGTLAISQANHHRWWGDGAVHGIGLYLAPGSEAASVVQELDRRLAEQGYTVWPNREVKRTSLRVFDRTFAVTDALTLAAAVIAALGVLNALLALNLSQRREHATLRAIGVTRARLRRHLYAQTMIVSGCAVVLAIPLGTLVAWILIDIINVRSFGWSMPFSLDGKRIAGPCLLALTASLLATVIPAERALRTEPADALRHE